MNVPTTKELDDLRSFLHLGNIAVLSGAGLSTDSGIPDYRGPKTKHIPRNPVKHDEFVNSEEARQRYWSRAARGYAAIGNALPNVSHKAIAKLEAKGLVAGTITQNVDGLHQRAGSKRVLELHGTLSRVRCLNCSSVWSRAEVQLQIEELNPGWINPEAVIAPDGDAEVAVREQTKFNVPKCPSCSGGLMPDVVFFGGSVPKARVIEAGDIVAQSNGLLVVGSSLTVFSGYRFARQAHREGKPIAIVSLGDTRADKLATLKLDCLLAEVLPRV